MKINEPERKSSPWRRPVATRVGAGKKGALFERLSRLLASGVTIEKAIHFVADDKTFSRFDLPGVSRQLLQGALLSEAMSISGVLNSFDQTMIRIGENTAGLEQSFRTLSDLYTERKERKAKVRDALLYPAVILIMSVVVTAVMLWVVVPMFIGMYARFGKELPALTKAVIWLSENFGWILIAILLMNALFVLTRRIVLKSLYAEKAVNLLYRVPLIGGLFLESIKQQAFFSLAVLLRAEIPLQKALSITADSSRSLMVKTSLEKAQHQIISGLSVSKAFRSSGIATEEEEMILSVGEESASLSGSFSELARIYASKMNIRSKTLITLLEPLLILILGAVVGTILIALYLPIFGLSTTIQ